jgi:hypothetical protein
MQMIGIAQSHLCADAFQVAGRKTALDRRCRGDIHKDRRLDTAVDRLHMRPLGSSLTADHFISHFCHMLVLSCFLVINYGADTGAAGYAFKWELFIPV